MPRKPRKPPLPEEERLRRRRESYRKYHASHKEKSQGYYLENKARIRARNDAWRAANRSKVNAAKKRRYDANPEHFVRAAVRSAKKNAAKRKAYMKEWNAKNKYRVRAYVTKKRQTKEYKEAAIHRAHVRTAQKNKCEVRTTKTQLARFIRASTTCFYCQRSDLPMTVDHFIPLSKGGAHALSNIVAACKPCNSSKRDRDPYEFMGIKPEPAFC